jgi:glycopeptide antibiotics resistance protein
MMAIIRMLNEKNLRWMFWSYLAALVLISVIPLNTVQALNNVDIVSIRGDYLVHALIFLPWAFVGLAAYRVSFLWFAVLILMAAATEIVQYFIQYRAFNINDLTANMIGVLSGLLLYLILARKVKMVLSG